jgi:hypothetical protein
MRSIDSIKNLMKTDLMVVGGGVGQGETFLSVLAATARQEAFAEIAAGCRFERALAGYEAGAIGAVQLAREAVARAPLGPARRDRRPLRS